MLKSQQLELKKVNDIKTTPENFFKKFQHFYPSFCGILVVFLRVKFANQAVFSIFH